MINKIKKFLKIEEEKPDLEIRKWDFVEISGGYRPCRVVEIYHKGNTKMALCRWENLAYAKDKYVEKRVKFDRLIKLKKKISGGFERLT